MKVFLLLIFLISSSGHASKNCLYSRLNQLLEADKKFIIINGGKADKIPDGSIVEGSIGKGGLQPHYLIDLGHPAFTPYLKLADELKTSAIPYWEKINLLNEVINTKMLRRREYTDPKYLRLLERFRKNGKDIPLSAYVKCSVGVCRENALIAHLLLDRAGIPNTHVYAKVRRKSNWGNYNVREDHAFVVVNYEGEDWVIDPYYVGFNGYRLKDLMKPRGITPKSLKAPIAQDHVEFRRIIKINDFPKALTPDSDVAH